MIVISSSVVLSSTSEDIIDGRNPRIGWRNLVRVDNVFADQEAEGFPASNLANPATYLYWRAVDTSQQAVSIALDVAQEVNYFAIAKHNLGSAGATITFQSSADGSTWTSVTAPHVLNTDKVVFHEFDTVFARNFRLLIEGSTIPPAIAVMYIGRTLVLQRRIYVGHTPFPYGRNTTVSNGRSENGQFLGRILRREFFESSVVLQNLTPNWYREHMEPFVHAARTRPFFWAWRPAKYPDESGFAWLTDDVKMSNQRPNGMVQCSFSMQGVR